MLDAERFLRDSPPFNMLPPSEINRIASNLLVKVYTKGEVIFKQGGPLLEFLYVVRKGLVVLQRDGQALEYLHDGESFGYVSLLSSEPPSATAIAQEDTVLFLIPKSVFESLLKKYSDFEHFFTKALASRIQRSVIKSNDTSIDKFANVMVSQLITRDLLIVDGNSTVEEVVKSMVERDSTYSLVKIEKDYGIITERDILKRVLAKGLNIKEVRAKDVATYPIVGVSANQLLIDAMLLMAKHGIRKIVVFENHKPVGVVEDRDIITFESKNLVFMIKEIDKAKSPEELSYIYRLVMDSAIDMVLGGADPERVGHYISELNDRFMKRAVYLTIKSLEMEPLVPFSIMVLGSEGRREQSLKTDQDNALIYEDVPMLDVDHKEYFKAFSEKYIQILLQIGFPPCPGNVMISNPYWRRDTQEWKKEIYLWVSNPKPENVLSTAIFFDFRNVFGSSALVEGLRDYVLETINRHKMFLPFLAAEAVKFKPPIGFFGGFVVEKSGEHKGEFDIKKSGIFPITQGIRALALEHGIKKTNTFERISELEKLGVFSKEYSKDIQESYRFLSGLRIKSQAMQIKEGKEPSNYINPDKLSKTERSLLKDVFKIVDKFQEMLSYRYNLRYFLQ